MNVSSKLISEENPSALLLYLKRKPGVTGSVSHLFTACPQPQPIQSMVEASQ